MAYDIRLSAADEQVIARLGISREDFKAQRRQEILSRAERPTELAGVPIVVNGVVLSVEDQHVIELLGMSREDFAAQRKLELAGYPAHVAL